MPLLWDNSRVSVTLASHGCGSLGRTLENPSAWSLYHGTMQGFGARAFNLWQLAWGREAGKCLVCQALARSARSEVLGAKCSERKKLPSGKL